MGTRRTNTIIDINGKSYDAVSGAFLGNRSASAAAQRTNGAMLEGITRVSRASKHAQPAHSQIAVPAAAAHPVTMDVKPRQPHQPGIHVKAHKPQTSKTLMRTAVKKPVIVSPAVIKAQSRTDILARTPSNTVQVKLSHTKVDSKRLRRAGRIIQSQAVSKFGNPAPASFTSASTNTTKPHLTPRAAMPAAPAIKPQASPVRSTLRATGLPIQQSIRPSLDMTPVRTTSHQHEQPSTAGKTVDIFEQALAEATSHTQIYNAPKSKRRFGTFAGVTATMLLLIGFLAFQNMPYISTKVAASKAGIEAKLPNYSPEGFTFGNLSYAVGNVTMQYYSKDDASRSFDISQRASDWNSKSLLDNFVASTAKSYQTVERAGRTFYIYGNGTATWIDSGIWYTIDGNESLSETQLLDVAMSI